MEKRTAMTHTGKSSRHSAHRKLGGPLMPLAHFGAWLYVLLLLSPLYYILISSQKTNIEIFRNPVSPVGSAGIGNYIAAVDYANLGQAVFNSAYITVGAEVLTLLLAVPAAYGLSRASGRLSLFIERIFALGFLIPGFAALMPTALLAISLGLFQTREFFILFLPATALPLTVILLVQAMRAIPKELEESAVLDGASTLEILWFIFMPLTMPTIVLVAIVDFLNFWNEYFFTLVIGGVQVEVRTIQVALPTLTSAMNSQFGILAAGIVVSLVPVYAVYALTARRMEEALIAGAVKG
ncbi:MAG: carbohydrate ABC transporter permease [Ancalomicrobiaceae bacterium]|nr:carbohydrate ABC transporter permease [Ancalomicrobiaceae bacterium]